MPKAIKPIPSAVVGDNARIVRNVCKVGAPAVVGVPANNNGGVSAHAVVTRPPTKNVSTPAVVGVPVGLCGMFGK